ncbi:hypothetical protein [Algoriphagus boritolerans]|uniref:hypothetical protein n=1 Tax=Algoriphagus boritolerans TaxID=308111 RepID=UPI002FCE3D36
MKRILILFLAVAMASPLFAQQIQQVPLIEVEGYAERKIAPDEAVFFNQSGRKSHESARCCQCAQQKDPRSL